MRTVKLITRSGELVTEVVIPAFILPPDVIVWGTRTFLHISAEEYAEGFSYTVVEVEEEKGNTLGNGSIARRKKR